MRRRALPPLRQRRRRMLIENTGIVVEGVDIEDISGRLEAFCAHLVVEACVLGAKVGDAEVGADAGAGDDHDVVAGAEEVRGVGEGVVLRELVARGEVAEEREAEQAVVAGVGAGGEELGRVYVEGGQEALGGVCAGGDGFEDEGVRADVAKAGAEFDGFGVRDGVGD